MHPGHALLGFERAQQFAAEDRAGGAGDGDGKLCGFHGQFPS